jgi:hypothetical protein
MAGTGAGVNARAPGATGRAAGGRVAPYAVGLARSRQR